MPHCLPAKTIRQAEVVDGQNVLPVQTFQRLLGYSSGKKKCISVPVFLVLNALFKAAGPAV